MFFARERSLRPFSVQSQTTEGVVTRIFKLFYKSLTKIFLTEVLMWLTLASWAIYTMTYVLMYMGFKLN